ncbi:MAG: cellulase family glycosylhydrolase, partial [Bacteroidia bacterium]|nr:cellulase family glycosylhydrolase [Bacteroidia bacterium]
LNEPIPDKKENLFLLYQKIIASIREADKNHLLILEGSNFAKDFSMFSSLPDENMAFSFHLYTWLGGDAAKKILPFTEISKKLNAPMWAGEWGENKYEQLKYTRSVFESPENNFCGWSFWTWKKVSNKYPALNQINPGVHWTVLIEAIQFRGKRKAITKESALLAMKEFLVSIRCANNSTDKALLDILKPTEK